MGDNVNDMDRQRLKQTEFLIRRFCDWNLICEIGVNIDTVKQQAEAIMGAYPSTLHKPVNS
jgi:hypothetical protein